MNERITVGDHVICDRVLGELADRTCNCGYLLPSYSQPLLDPYVHLPECNYRRQVTGTGLLTVGAGQPAPLTKESTRL